MRHFDGTFQGHFRSPVYLSDAPGDFIKENIFPLIDKQGAPVMQLVKATPVASFIILALVWVSGSSLSVLISFFDGAARPLQRSAHRHREC